MADGEVVVACPVCGFDGVRIDRSSNARTAEMSPAFTEACVHIDEIRAPADPFSCPALKKAIEEADGG